jgi:cytoskeleton protein RodZ
VASIGIGVRLRQERVGQGLTLDEISRNTRIPLRFLEAIELEQFSQLPSLVFIRSFVRQYALVLKLDPRPLLAELPKPDESTFQLPDPKVRPQSSYQKYRTRHSILYSTVWLLLAGGAGVAAYVQFNYSVQKTTPQAPAPDRQATRSPQPKNEPVEAAPVEAAKEASPEVNTGTTSAETTPVQVSLTASEAAWIQVSADGKTAFTGTLKSNETKEVSAAEQVKILTGNAGALRISLNGKTLESLGPLGQVRSVKLTVGGPQLLSKAPPSVPDEL